MTFWSGEKLAAEGASLVHPFDANRIDCASYKLTVGEEAFVTSDKFDTDPPSAPLLATLEKAPPRNTIRIRPGQFAFILTDERVTVPSTAMALISMSSKYKIRGLINVSGFHVDPGFAGKLLFTVYHAGPAEIVIARGDPMFMIVFASLNQPTAKLYNGTSQNQQHIRHELLQNMTEQVFSPQMLRRKTDDLSDELRKMQEAAAGLKGITYGITGIATVLLAAGALIATFAPATLGIVLAKTIEYGGYEMKLKPEASAGGAATPTAQQIATPASGAASGSAAGTSARK